MCQYFSETKDGTSNDVHLGAYSSYAAKGYGLIIQESTAISPEGRISPEDLGIWDDKHIPGLKRIVDLVHHYGTKMGVQLNHSGRKGSTYSPFRSKGRALIPLSEGGWSVVGPSSVPYNAEHGTPRELTIPEIQSLVESFVSCAKRSISAGYDFIEIHAAHGYLIHQFLSPLSNHRTDEYGGSFVNRTRFLREIVSGIREVISGDTPLFVRLSVTDYVERGWSVEESKKLILELVHLGVDVFHLSTAGLDAQQKIPSNWDHQLILASDIKKETGVCVACVGGVWDGVSASDAVNEKNCDFVMIGRATIRGAFVPHRIAVELGVDATSRFPENTAWATRVPPHCSY